MLEILDAAEVAVQRPRNAAGVEGMRLQLLEPELRRECQGLVGEWYCPIGLVGNHVEAGSIREYARFDRRRRALVDERDGQVEARLASWLFPSMK